MKKIKYFLIPFLSLHIVCFYLSSYKSYIIHEVECFHAYYRFSKKTKIYGVWQLLTVLLFCKEFRNIFYNRVFEVSRSLHVSYLLELILPPYRLLSIGTPSSMIGRGLFIEHGNSTIIHAKKIGDNCWINQNVTIGDSGKGIPEIGNDVRVGTGAVIIGPIKVGDNVVIGANATIVKDVPSNTTVVPSPSYIVRQDGKKIRKLL